MVTRGKSSFPTLPIASVGKSMNKEQALELRHRQPPSQTEIAVSAVTVRRSWADEALRKSLGLAVRKQLGKREPYQFRRAHGPYRLDVEDDWHLA